MKEIISNLWHRLRLWSVPAFVAGSLWWYVAVAWETKPPVFDPDQVSLASLDIDNNLRRVPSPFPLSLSRRDSDCQAILVPYPEANRPAAAYSTNRIWIQRICLPIALFFPV